MWSAFAILGINNDPDDPLVLNSSCSAFSESYQDIFGDNNVVISQLSEEKARHIHDKLSDDIEEYESNLHFWSNIERDYEMDIATKDEYAPIIVDHTINKSCSDYWRYTKEIRPILEDNLSNPIKGEPL